MAFIYIIENRVNNKVYIGQTTRKVHTRVTEHYRDKKSAIYPDVVKYGRDSFTYRVLHECDDLFSDQWEHYFICKYDSTDPSKGYNKVSTRSYMWVKGGENPSTKPGASERISLYNKEHLEQITKGLMKYNESKKFPIWMLDDNDNVLGKFDCLADACRFLGKKLFRNGTNKGCL